MIKSKIIPKQHDHKEMNNSTLKENTQKYHDKKHASHLSCGKEQHEQDESSLWF